MTQTTRAHVRRHYRQQRKQLSQHQQHQHAQQLAAHFCRSRLFRSARRLACYLPADGEISPEGIMQKAWQYKKQLYLPILPPTGKSLFFAPYTPDTPMKANRFGIDEPDIHPCHWIRARQLNLILLPLVAFDEQGNRMGMGGGYYDRSLSFSRHHKQWHSPHLIGLAHECQKAEQLPSEPWDVPLHGVATERGFYGGLY